MTTQQNDALQCAADLEYSIARHGMQDAFTLNAYRAMKMVRTQHARIADLEAQLEAIGAGGVSGPLIGQPQAMPDLSQLTERGAKAWAGVDAQGLRDGGASPSANAGEPSAHIKEPYTLAEIKAKIASNDYSAEMLLQHAMLLLDSASLSANAGQAGEYPALVCDYCGALTPDPWHSSGMLHGKMSKHIHSCDACADATHTLRASHGQAPADAAPSAGAVAGPDDIDAIALTRYKVVHSHESMFHRWAVVAGDGAQQLYIGREVECENMARKFAGAFLDGAFYQANITPSTQAADSVQEDAARYRWLREGNDAKHGAAWHVAVNLYGCEWDAAIDAAMNKGASHDR